MNDRDSHCRREDAERGSSADGPRTLNSQEIFQGASEVLIDHSGETYRLRITRTGKLILTK